MKPLLALLAGAVTPLAFAPFGWWPLGLLSGGVLFALWLTAGRVAAAGYGFLYGVGLFGVGASWVYVSIHTYGGMPPLLAAGCVALLVVGVSLLPSAAGFVQGCINANRVLRAVLVMPAVWLLFEWLRGWVLSGFPWLTTGYAFIDTPLAGLAPLGGVYLLSLAALMTAGALTALALTRARAAMAAVAALALVWAGGWQLRATPWTQARGAPLAVAVVQNNVPLSLKWDAARSAQIIADYLAQSERHRDADLVVWPEAAAPDYFAQLPRAFFRRLRDHPADFLFGVLTRRQAGGEWQTFNSIAAVGAPAEPIAFYHKQHLVPFGEFLPLRPLFQPLMDAMQIPMSDFTAWHAPQQPLRVAGAALAASVCYEDAFPQEWRAQVPAAGALVNLSEDIWFGDSLAPHQRLQMARFRALESGRPMIRASNNGLSSVINWRGGIDALAPQFVKTVLTAQVRPRSGVTPYIRYGNAPALLLALALLALGLLWGARMR